MIASPPSPFEVKATVAELLPGVTPVTDGADGAPPATKGLVAVEATLSPNEFVATTTQV